MINSEEKGWLLCSYIYMVLLINTVPSPCPMQSNSRICSLSINTDDIIGRTSSTTCGDTDLSLDIGATASIINNKDNNYSGFMSLMPHTSKSAHGGGGGRHNNYRRRSSCSDHSSCWSLDPATATDSKFNTTDSTHRSYDWQKYEQ